MQEYELYQLWRSFSEQRRYSDNKRLIGIYPGRMNTIEGPDFESAEFQLDGRIYRGDVEIHVRFNDWHAHGHHLDPKYDRVMLHLVWEDLKVPGKPVYNSRGQEIPTFSFRNFPPYRHTAPAKRCHLHKQPDNLALYNLASDRFLQQGRSLTKRMAYNTRDQILYQQLLYLIGKPQNGLPFLRLAEVMTWRDITYLRKNYHMSVDGWHYIFLRLAGLAPCDTGHPEERLLSSLPFQTDVWIKGGQRPSNRPGQRLYGLAHFISRSSSVSLYMIWHELLVQRLPVSSAITNLIHLHISQENQGWGKGQALEIIGNIVLPYLYFESLTTGSNGFADYLAELYFNLPRANKYGQLKTFKSVYNNKFRFYKDQVYLHTLNHFCRKDDCRSCPLVHSTERD